MDPSRHWVGARLLTVCGLGLGCRVEHDTTPSDADPARQSTSVECGERPIELIVTEDGGCVADCDGTRWCWGADLRAKLIEPDEVESVYLQCLKHLRPESECRDLGARLEFVGVSDFQWASHVCDINRDAEVVCAGDNRYAQLGLGDTRIYEYGGIDEVDLPGPARAVGVAREHTCAALDDRIMCWGALTVSGPESNRFAFEATDIRVDEGLSCAKKADETVWCWGSPRDEDGAIEDRFGGIEVGVQPRQVVAPWPVDAVGPSWMLGDHVLRHVTLDGDLAAGNDDVIWQTRRVRDARAGYEAICVHWLDGRLRCVQARDPEGLVDLATHNAKHPDDRRQDIYSETDDVSNFSLDWTNICVVRRGKVECAIRFGFWKKIDFINEATDVGGSCALEASGSVTCWDLVTVDIHSYDVAMIWPTRAHDVVDIAGRFVLTKRGSLEQIHDDGELEVLVERGVVQYDADEWHACARIDDDGDGRSETIACFGDDSVGQLGRTSDAQFTKPTVVEFVTGD